MFCGIIKSCWLQLKLYGPTYKFTIINNKKKGKERRKDCKVAGTTGQARAKVDPITKSHPFSAGIRSENPILSVTRISII